MGQKQPYYITTPIYYVNDYPHIGHAYTTVACDAAARYQRLQGREVYFLTGSDEHGEKIEKSAKENGETPIELADRVVERLKLLWQQMNMSHDDFIRTTEERHVRGAKLLFETVQSAGDIYLGEYEGWYCVPCEAYWTETQLLEGNKCPSCSRPTEKLKESSYFFRMSKYGDKLLEHIKNNPNFIQPVSKRNEVVSFVEQGLRDLSISRTSFNWGIPVPGDEKHIIYVWFDALSNYMTAVGYGDNKNAASFEKWWPATFHVVGKDILRFHAVYWPTFLMAAGLPLPKTVYAHGWWTVEGDKMSKSKGNFVDPFEMVEKYGADAFRYFLLRAFSFGQDGDFSQQTFINTVNSDLANDLGNLTSRSMAMVSKYCDGKVPNPSDSNDTDKAFLAIWYTSLAAYQKAMEHLQFETALKSAWEFVSAANRYVDDNKPWELAKAGDDKRLHTVLFNMIEGLRCVSVLVSPFIPMMANELRAKLQLTPIEKSTSCEHFFAAQASDHWPTEETMKPGTAVEKGAPLFQRIDTQS